MNEHTDHRNKGTRLDLDLTRLLVQYGRIESLSPGQVLLRRGDPLEDVYVVMSGQLSASRGRSRGGPQLLEVGATLGSTLR